MFLIRNWQHRKLLSPFFDKGSVATIGNFDGFHKGHQRLISQLQEAKKQYNMPSIVFLFEPQPNEFFNKSTSVPRIMSLREKLVALAQLDVSVVCILTFNRKLAEIEAHEFIGALVDSFKLKHLVIGDDFRFGKNRLGDQSLLKKLGLQLGFEVAQANALIEYGERVSSTRVRAALNDGNLSLASALLSHAIFFTAKVVYGSQLGQTIGIPTANFALRHRIYPVSGVFIVMVSDTPPILFNNAYSPHSAHLSNASSSWRYFGVANIGVRPTIDGKGISKLEVHILNFTGNLYGKRLYVTLLEKIRGEKRFDSINSLKEAINADVAYAVQWIDQTFQVNV